MYIFRHVSNIVNSEDDDKRHDVCSAISGSINPPLFCRQRIGIGSGSTMIMTPWLYKIDFCHRNVILKGKHVSMIQKYVSAVQHYEGPEWMLLISLHACV